MCSPRPPALSRGLGPVHAEQETEIHVDGQPGGAEHVPKLPCVDVSKVAAAGHIGDAARPPVPGARKLSMATSMSTCILAGGCMSAGPRVAGSAHAFDARAVLGGERGDLFGLREALSDDDAVARLFGDERFEAEQVGGRGHDVLIARIGAYFGLQRPLEQAHFRGKELLVGVEEFRIGKAFHPRARRRQSTASSIVPRISPIVPSRLRWVCMDLDALRRAFASSLPSGEASERRTRRRFHAHRFWR